MGESAPKKEKKVVHLGRPDASEPEMISLFLPRSKRTRMRRYLSLLVLPLMVLFIPSTGWPDEKPAQDRMAEVAMSYQSGSFDKVVDLLVGKEVGDSQEALYLGLSYLRLGNAGKAIDAWKTYVRLNGGREGSREVSQYLTLLIREEAKKHAKEIRQREKTLSTGELDPSAVAVSPFQNLGSQEYEPLSKGLAEMIITDLSQVKTLKVVERIQIQALLDELKLSKSGLVAKETGPRIGKLLGAGKITTGSFLDMEQEKMRLDAAVAQTEDGKVLTSPEVTGELSTFYQLEKVLVFKILCGLGHCPESLDSRTKSKVETIHTKSYKAFYLYSEGLDYRDKGKYREASRSFFLALEEDPQFMLARKALLETPLFPMDLFAIASGGEALAQGENGMLAVLPPPVAPITPNLVVTKGAQNVTVPQISQQPVEPVTVTTPVSIQVGFGQ